jgi:3-oxoacyl-[acyl-carrier protein] reductase
MRLKGKVAVVTGASRGIGRAVAAEFARQGAAVVVNYARGEAQAEALAASIQGQGGRAVASRADVSDKAQVEAMFERALCAYGRVDILVNNAGIFREANIDTLTGAALDELFAVNVKGVLFCAQAASKPMRAQGYGRIVNVSSISALGTRVGDNTGYSASKAAVNALTKRFALELGVHGITVNAVCPGPVRTDMYAVGTPAESEQRIAAVAQRAMLRRIAEPEDVAHAALFFASDEARHVTGQILTVDGGRTDFLTHSG